MKNINIIDLFNLQLENPHKNTKYLNHCAFDDLSDPETLYWIGMLYADGWLETSKNKTRICLSLSDHDQIIKYKKFLNSEHTISKKEHNGKKDPNTKHLYKHMYSIRFTSIRILTILNNLGFTNKKSHIIKPHDLLKNEPAFWMGVFDGDGSISHRRNYQVVNVNITGNIYTCKSFQEFIFDNYDIETNFNVSYENKNSANVVIKGGYKKTLLVYEILLNSLNNHNIALNRKKEKYLDIVDNKKFIPILLS